ncbi:hypothetical protein GIB67_041452, partial [Kingdonia uniflora]
MAIKRRANSLPKSPAMSGIVSPASVSDMSVPPNAHSPSIRYLPLADHAIIERISKLKYSLQSCQNDCIVAMQYEDIDDNEYLDGEESICLLCPIRTDELQCRGSLDKVLKWYQWIAVYSTLKKLVDDMGFEEFCSIKAGNSDNRLIHALVERWWPSTHTFHFPCGELGFIPLDFVMLTGRSFVRGRELPYSKRYSKIEEAKKMFPGITSSDIRYGNITLSYLKKWKEPLNLRLHNYDSQMDIVYARAFIAYMMGNLFFSNGSTSLQAGYLVAVTYYDILGASHFDWSTPIIAALYRGLDEVSVLRDKKVKKSITRFYAMLEFRFFEYCRVGMYLVKVQNFNHIYPRIGAWRDERASTGSEIHHSFVVIRDMIEWKDITNIDWQPWHRSRQLICPEVKVVSALSFQKVPLVSVPYGHSTLWYLGDRCMRPMTGQDSMIPFRRLWNSQ